MQQEAKLLKKTSAVHGKMFLVTIKSKNLWTLKAFSGRVVELKDYARKKF